MEDCNFYAGVDIFRYNNSIVFKDKINCIDTKDEMFPNGFGNFQIVFFCVGAVTSWGFSSEDARNIILEQIFDNLREDE